MNKITIKICVLSIVILFTSCYRKDVKNLRFDGVVKSELTGEPIQLTGKELKVDCHKRGENEIDESYADLERVYLQTKKDGTFSVNFDKGSLAIFVIEAKGYNRYVKKVYLEKSKNTVEIKLVPKDTIF